ncbi:MAG: TOPRIM nucleotidyl transferase/hydrolase domain-containing protein [Pseudomonadota bacterium]
MSKQRQRRPDEFAPGPRPPLGTAAACELLSGANARAAILVEGWSDQAALEALALRRGRDLRAEGIGIVPMGGITNIVKFAQALGPRGLNLRLAGLCDAAEEPHVTHALHHVGLGSAHTRAEREALGFFVCEADLEDELIRAVGTAAVERVIDGEGELTSFRRFQDQPAQRGRNADAHLRRFMGTRARRKIRYGSLLVDALPLEHVPRALDLVLVHHRR